MGLVGPETGKHLRNIAIIVVLAVAVWKVPGGGDASQTISNLLTIIFVGGLLFFGYRMYMENRETLFGLPERQRGILYAARHHHDRRHPPHVGRGRRPRRDLVARFPRLVDLGRIQRLARVPRVLVAVVPFGSSGRRADRRTSTAAG